eukprot:scaffold375_cov200-Alexandrium_tamarense.AAC.17
MPRQKARRHNSGTSDRSLSHRTPAGNKSHWLIKHTVDSHHNIHCVRLSTTLSTRPDLQIQTNCNTHQHKASTMKLSPILPLMMSIIDPSLALLHPSHQPRLHLRFTHHTRQTTSYHRHDTSLAYKPSDSDNEGDNNVWTVLANTERWISDTLEKSNRSAASRNTNTAESKPENEKKMHFADEKQSASAAANNPYARKEVTYACETAGELAGVVGGVFRRVREARELGERHGRESLLDKPTTLRQTNVVVIPNCDEISEFRTFDSLVQAINQARRKARDFVIKKEEGDDMRKDWTNNSHRSRTSLPTRSVSINCAHLHPDYGQQTPEETLAAMKQEEEEGEVDVNLQEYKKRRDEARRSPYPSVIVEVQSTPPPDFGSRSPLAQDQQQQKESPQMKIDADEGVTSEDVKRLEALFGMSAASKKADDAFYDALGDAFGKQQVEAQTPLSMAQHW